MGKNGSLRNSLRYPRLRQKSLANGDARFWCTQVRRPPGGVGVFHAKGWWPKTSCPPSKLRLPWVSKRGIRDVLGILPGCPGPLAVFKKFVQKTSCAFFVPYLSLAIYGMALRAKGTLISEPRFSIPCEMRFFPREKGKTAFLEKNPRKRPFSLSRVGKNASRRGWTIGAH